ncbi:MAG: T9SS type A sorting domain-containing protein, partial [Ignavibacteria bacterium]|nr:T9SS type A sorting domain-containing protein [Ignavibacteria bacterium]
GFIYCRFNGDVNSRAISITLYNDTSPWMHVAATYDGVNTKMYINGVLENSAPYTTAIVNSANSLFIANDPSTTGRLFQGFIDEVRLWNVVRSEVDIRANMTKKLIGNESGLVGYWRFNETSGTLMSDETVNNNDGTLTASGGGEHTWSGAALGDASAYDYTGSAGTFSANLDHPAAGDDITATTTTGTGIQVYRVDDNSVRTLSNIPIGWASVDPLRYWGVKVIGSSATYDVVYNYAGHPNLGTIADLRLAKRANIADDNWVDAVATPGTDILSLTGQTGTEYALGSISSPLPVELSSFSASILKNGVKLKWRTETEVSNYGFEILRSVLDDNWDVLGFVEGHGNSNSPKDYSFTDDNLTQGKYSYRLKQIDTDGSFNYSKTIEVEFGSADKFELSQNYPNPFNPVTTIRFSIPHSSNVKLTVFNILGEQVAELVNGFREAGVHKINFDASEFNSGLYLYKLESNGLIQTRKMLLVK